MSGSTIRLRWQIPYCLAAEMLLCGDHITAQQALEFGLINRVVADGTTLEVAKQFAAKICANGPLAASASGVYERRRCHVGVGRVGGAGICLSGRERGDEGI